MLVIVSRINKYIDLFHLDSVILAGPFQLRKFWKPKSTPKSFKAEVYGGLCALCLRLEEFLLEIKY